MMQNAGAQTAALAAPEHLSISWYPSATAMVAGLEKNMYGMIGGFSPVRLVLRIGLLSAWMVAHFLVFLAVGIPWLPRRRRVARNLVSDARASGRTAGEDLKSEASGVWSCITFTCRSVSDRGR